MQQTQGTVGTGIYQAVRLDKQIGIVRARAAGQAAQAEQQEEVMRQFHVGEFILVAKIRFFYFRLTTESTEFHGVYGVKFHRNLLRINALR